MRLASRARTALALGPLNIARALAYRSALRSGLHPVQRVMAETPSSGPYFHRRESFVTLTPRGDWRDDALVFGHRHIAVEAAPPDWLGNVMNGTVTGDATRPWWQIPDFGSVDIKTVWELSRLDWLLALAQVAASGDEGALDRLNQWLQHWLDTNPAGCGPNWKCGQEASIRVLHLAAAAIVLDQVAKPEPALTALVRLHLQRIAPTLSYALSQDNNHGTSEAVALFVGGSWLASLGDATGHALAKRGRRTIEERIGRLVTRNGTFSQYSVTYHRMMLDTVSFAEVWRRRMGLAAFSSKMIDRVQAAAAWLHCLTDDATGDAPNTGSNDGTHILRLSDEPYRDFRGSVQLARVLFCERRAYADAIPGDATLAWLGVALPREVAHQPTRLIDEDGGFAVVRRGGAMLLLRFPRFRFRPGQADVLHVDYWRDGRNLLRDTGTYGYHSGENALHDFAGVAGHNTVQFDGHDQMPRLGRFLYTDWIAPSDFSCTEQGSATRLQAGYRDRWGCRHERIVTLDDDGTLDVVDRLGGQWREAVLRWHLPPGEVRLSDEVAEASGFSIRITSDARVDIAVTDGWESRHYLEKTVAPSLTITTHQLGDIRTMIVAER